MDIGSILIGLAVLAAAAFLISQPLLDRREKREKTLSEADRLREQRDRLLVTLRDLDFDHASGKINEDDYTPLRAQLVAEGATVLKQLDELRPGEPERLESQLEQAIAARRQGRAPTAGNAATADAAAADDIEQAIAARRRGKAPAASADEIERAIAARRQKQAPAEAAGAGTAAADEVERAIAARRKPRPAAGSGDMIYCPQCGQAALAGDKFCAMCGAKLPSAPSTKDSA